MFVILEKQNSVIEDLTLKYNRLESHCLKFERLFRKNNIIIFGLAVTPGSNLLDLIINKIKSLPLPVRF